MSRRFVTKSQIDAIADRGESVLEVDDRTTVTDVAREHAMRRGVTIVRSAGATASTAPAGERRAGAADPEATRSAVRSGVLAALGEMPPGLDDAIDRVLGRPS